jgi:type I restriction enzyme M protein
MDLIPPELVVGSYFERAQNDLDDLNQRLELATQAIEEFIEENLGEDGPLMDAAEDGKVTKGMASSRLKEAKREGSDPDEIVALTRLLALYEDEAVAKRAAKEAKSKLDAAVLAKYNQLDVDDIQDLVVSRKWGGTVSRDIDEELEKLTHQLQDRIRTLASRYGTTVGSLDEEVRRLAVKLEAHLAEMGVR